MRVNVGRLDGFDMSWIQNVSDFTNGQEFTLENQKQGGSFITEKIKFKILNNQPFYFCRYKNLHLIVDT